jgi:hypothetical protein
MVDGNGAEEDRGNESSEQREKKERYTAEERALHTQRTQTTELISDQLGETEAEPRRLIFRIVKHLGIEASLSFLQRTHEVEAAGGLMLPDGSRRRTIGGVFFYLVRHEISPEISKRIFPPAYQRRRQLQQQGKVLSDHQPAAARPKSASQRSTEARFAWEDRLTVLNELKPEERGEVRTVKVTLVGRPGRIVEQGQCVITTMQQSPEKIPSLPKGLPLPAPDQVEPTVYAIYISLKQWRNKKIAELLQNPDDILIIEGFQLLDKKKPGMISVFANNITTKMLQAAQKQTQQAAT